MKQIDPRKLRDAFGTFMTGVTVVTSHNGQGAPIGFTANSFTSVSLDPPLLLISLARTSSNFSALTSSEGFAVNILSEDQEQISNRFARPVEDRYADVGWQKGPFGSPVLDGVAAWFDCSMHKVVDAGDHVLLIGQIEAFNNAGLNGLGYIGGSYIKPSLESQAANTAGLEGGIRVGAVLEHEGMVLLKEQEDGGFDLPSVLLDSNKGGRSHAERLADEIGPSLSVGFIYSVYDDTERGTHNIVYRCTSSDGSHNSGKYFKINNIPFERIADSASRDILKRYQREHSIGNFGVYYGNEQSGDVRRLARGLEQ
ncbi:flavin reductase [Hoeflea sp. TYP-13]|uniref:flavin reductase n=1 Tax=Hoeflea sp. TYP-13 TaxID=3230023 RepID=UPI0034C622AA